MAAVEQVFTNAKTGFFLGISSDFSFTVDEPVYAKNAEANEQALKDAVGLATRKATLLADAASVRLGAIDQLTELVRTPRRRSIYEHEDPMDFDEHLGVVAPLYDLAADDSFVDYTPVSPKETTRIVQVRVRFGVSHD